MIFEVWRLWKFLKIDEKSMKHQSGIVCFGSSESHRVSDPILAQFWEVFWELLGTLAGSKASKRGSKRVSPYQVASGRGFGRHFGRFWEVFWRPWRDFGGFGRPKSKSLWRFNAIAVHLPAGVAGYASKLLHCMDSPQLVWRLLKCNALPVPC